MYGNSDKPVDFSKKPRDVPRKLQSNVYKELTHRELGFNLGRANPEIEAVAEDKLVTKNYLEMRCELPGQTRSTFLMVFSPDGKKVASTHGNHNVYVTDLTTGKNINTLSGHPRTPWCIAFHPSSNQILATGCLGGQVRVWDLHGGSEVWMAEGQTVIASLAFHPTDRMLVIATYNELHFWDWSQSAPFAKCYTSNEKEKVRYVAFDPLGHKLITGISNVPPHSTQWDRSAGSHHLSHHHHLYHHQPFQRTAARYHAMHCTHHQQSTNVSGERNEDQLERDSRVNDGIPHLSSQREGRTQSSSGEATSTSTSTSASSSNPPQEFERRISVCYRSLAQRYEQLLQRYFDLVRPRLVVTTDRGTDPMEAEETSGSSASAVPADSTNRCSCNNTATNTDNNWTVRNRSGASGTTSNTRARKSTRGFSSSVNSSSSSSSSSVNGTQTTNSHVTSNSCPCFNDINMCRNICQRNSSSSSGICSRTPSTSGTSGSSSTLTCVTGSSTNNANMQSGNSQASPQPVCPIHTEVVPNELSNQDPEGQPLQSANYSSATSSGHKSSGPSRVANENSLSGNMQSSEPSRVANENSLSGNMQSGNRQASPQAVCPRHTGVVPNEVSNQDPGGQPSQSAKYSSVTSSCHKSSEPSRMDRQNNLASPAVRPAESTTTITPCNRMETEQSENATITGVRAVLRAMEGRDFGLGSLGQQQQDLLPQAQSTISNNPRERHVCQQHGSISRRRNEHRLPRLTLAQVVAGVDATAALYRDVRRLRCGILSLNNQIDSIQSICRARMEVLQLQHIRRTWDNLQHQINTIQRAVTLTPSPYLLGTDTTEEDQPAQVPNVSQLLELTRISDGEPANESSEVRASSSSSGYQNVVRTACDQSETEETASVQASQDCTDDGDRPAKRIKLDPQTPSVPTQNELATDGANVSSKVHHSVSELATSNSDPSVIDEGCNHENISGRNKLESATSSSSQDVARQSTQGKSEKLVGHNLPVVGLMSASCSSASGSASRNSDSVAGPSKISRGFRASSLYNSGGGRRGRNVDDVTVRNIVSHQERLNEMQNMVRGLQERLNQRIAERQGFRRLDREREPSYWKFCPRHGTNIARAGSCRNCGARHPRLQPPTVHLGNHLPQPRPIYSTVRPQELVASSQARPANIPPHENISCKSLQQTNSEICTSNCGNVKEEETSCDNKNVCSSKEMTNKPLCGKKHDDTKNMSCVVRTCCMANSSKRTSEEQGENSASSQNNNSKEQEIHAQKHLCGEVTHSQNQVRCSSVTEGVSNSVINKTESVSHSNLVASSQEELPHDTSVINVTNKQNSSCLHSDVNTTPSVENNSVESNPCNPSGNPADLLSETAAYPANMHPFIPGAVTNFCGNLGESSSGHLYTHALINPTPEDLRSPERRAANSGDQLPQVNPSHRQNDNVHGNESTSTTSHSSRGSDRVVSHSERAPNGLRRHIGPRPNPPIIPRQASLMCPLPDPLIMARPALPTPRASPLLVPGSVQESLRCPPMLHVGGRYYVPRPRFHHRTGHSSRGRILSRPVMPAEQLRRPWFLQTLTQTYRSCAGRSGGELGGRCNEFIRQIGATPRNPVSRPTRNCTSHSQERGSHGNTNQCTENAHTCLRWRQPVESSSENSESTSQASSGNHREVIFENRDETAVNMSKCQALGSTSGTSEQSGESRSSKQSASITSDQLVMPTTMDCAQLPEVEVKQPAHTSDLDNGESSTDNKDTCAGDNTISLPVAEISKSTLSSSCGNNDTEPFCAPLDSSAMKDVTHSTSQTVACKAGHSETAREIVPSSSSSLLNGNGSSSQSTVPDIKENTSEKIAEALLTRSPSESTVPGITENTPQNTAEAHFTQSPSERNEDVNVSQPQESGGRSAATQTPGPPLGRPESVGPSVVSSTPPAQNGASQQMPRYGTGQTVRDIFSRLQRLLDHERMYRQSFMERNRTNSQPTRGSSGAFNTTPAHSNDVWSRWTRRHSDILPERSADDEGLSYSGHAASVAAERLITALQTELCETERLYQRLANLPRSSGSPDQIPGEAAQETTRRRARQVLCSMVESLTQVFEESDPCHTFSRDVSNSRIRVFLSDLYFLLQLSVELVDLLMIQISRPWTRVGTQVENGVENTSNSRQYTRDQISHSRPRGTGSFRFYARRGSSGHRPSDGYSRQPSAGASGTVHPSPVRTLSRHRSGRSLGRGSWVHRFFGASTRFLPGMMQSTAGTDAEIPQVRVVSPVDRDGHGDSERGGAVSRSTYHPLLTRGVRGRFQRGPSTSHHESQQRHNDLFHNFHNYCRQPEEEGQDQQQQQQRDSHPSQPSNHRSEQQRQNPQELEGQQQEEQRQQEQQQQPPPEERQHPQQLSPGSGQHDDQSQQQEHLEQQPQDGTHAPERNSEYRSEHSQNQRGSNNQQLATSASQILNSSHQRRQQAQQNSDMFAVPAVQLNDVPIADVGQLSQIEPPHIRPQSPPANPFGVVSRQSHQMLGGLPPSERWLVNFDEVYPNPGFANTTSVTERRLYPPFSFMGYGQGSQSEPSSSRPSTSNLSGSSHGPINNNSPPVNDGHIHRPQTDTASLTYGAPTGWRSRFLHPRYVGPNMFNDDAFASIENFSFIRGPDTVIITDAPLSPNHRIQAWDISKFNIPDISNAEKNIIVSECKIHNDASVDVSKDGTLLVTLLPSTRICVTTMLGIYSLEWESLGQCLYTTSFEQNAVSVSLSPACRHLLVGLASRRIVLPTDRPTVAQIFRMEGAKPGRSVGGRGRLCHLRDIEQNRENSFTSLNCIRWAPEPGQGLVYGTNTGTLRVLR